ncbi:MAG: hypothetical protein A2Z34_10695 [Planctomycetes bacterium RBG_16_59_8]|nr:MAG: hypothetical protein A2Z34_10695 [Planctomycetes bacterium RBG_16_59_8]
MYRLRFEKRVFKDLDKIPNNDALRIDNNIRMLKENPHPPGSKKLTGEHSLYRIRQGNYRIIYTVSHATREVRILAVRHRKEAYR